MHILEFPSMRYPKICIEMGGWNQLLRGHVTHRVQWGGGSEVRQETHFQQVQEEVLVLDAVNPVQKQNHGCFVIRTEPRWHIRLDHGTV